MSMEIRPIKNNRDYREALKEIDRLMDARPNTAEGDRLDVLVTLVGVWEEKHWPIDLPDPVEAILHLTTDEHGQIDIKTRLVN
jgi:HTH-type transcriptional regulator/antitoxin HigA